MVMSTASNPKSLSGSKKTVAKAKPKASTSKRSNYLKTVGRSENDMGPSKAKASKKTTMKPKGYK
jgi:hypothetical protein